MEINKDKVEQSLGLMDVYEPFQTRNLNFPEDATNDQVRDLISKEQEQRRRRAPIHVLQALIALVGENFEVNHSLCAMTHSAMGERPERTTWRALWLTDDNHLAFVEAYRLEEDWDMNKFVNLSASAGITEDWPDGLTSWIRPVRTVNRLAVDKVHNSGLADYDDGVTRLSWNFGFTVHFDDGGHISVPLFTEEAATSDGGFGGYDEEFFEALKSIMRTGHGSTDGVSQRADAT